MGECRPCRVIMVLLAMVLTGGHVAACILSWLPELDVLNDLIEVGLDEQLLTKTLPIAGAAAAGIGSLLLLVDAIKYNNLVKFSGMVAFTAAAGCVGYAVGRYLHRVIILLIKLSAFEITGAIEDNAEIASWINVSEADIEKILTDLGFSDFNDAGLDVVKSLGDSGLHYGGFVATAAVIGDILLVVIYSFILCCCRKE